MLLGVNAPPTGWHDAAACLVDHDGTLLAFCEEERLSRDKHAERSGPRLAIRYCLEQAGAQLGDIDLVAVGWDVPLGVACTAATGAWRTRPPGLASGLGWPCTAQDMPEVRFVGHHLAHATIAFRASDFEQAAVLVVDGNGDDESISIYRADRERGLVRKRVWPRSHSLGYLYDAASRFAGFGPLQAGKLMGLSAYGRAAGVTPWELLPGGEPRAPAGLDDGDGFNRYIHGWSAELDRLAGGRRPARGRQELHLDALAVQVAVSAQEAVERAVDRSRRPRARAGRDRQPLPRRRCRAELQGQRAAERPGVRPAGPARRGHRARRRLARRAAGPLGRADVRVPRPGARRRGATERSTACTARRCRSSAGVRRCRPAAVVPSSTAPAGSVRARWGHRSIASPTPAIPGMHRRLERHQGPRALAALRRGGAGAPRAATLWEPRPRLSDYMLAGTPVTDTARETIPAAVHVDGTARPQEVEPGAAATSSRRCSANGATARAVPSSTRRSTALASRSCPATATRSRASGAWGSTSSCSTTRSSRPTGAGGAERRDPARPPQLTRSAGGRVSRAARRASRRARVELRARRAPDLVERLLERQRARCRRARSS